LPEPDGPGTWLVRLKRGGALDIPADLIAALQERERLRGNDDTYSPAEPAVVEIAAGQQRFDAGSFGGDVADHGAYEWRRVGIDAQRGARGG
jgi:hypothetical protein